ncbi:hypothetical protein Thimo_2239 [Thioflavicoccus mobilis 8321]|uniref:Uncharacterized protein n=1 Tax=Thioflavicoccus mobilis 8321 TaxID=765912 RepID=L0GYH1_9GAMM|nr:hypothetical protein [Thioflavicoccus mobilis]AGA90986.1 hypothetical protein Thimo_2239 [Thioflavicoccus mobilis 8321]
MTELFASGRIIDLIILMVIVEALLVWFYHRRTGRGPTFAAVVPTLTSGALLMLALRAAIADLSWVWIAVPLFLSLVAHMVDLVRR